MLGQRLMRCGSEARLGIYGRESVPYPRAPREPKLWPKRRLAKGLEGLGGATCRGMSENE